VRADDRPRLPLSGCALVSVYGESENGGQRVGRCNIDYVVRLREMKVVGTRKQFTQCGFVPSGKPEVRDGLGLDCVQ
jgi:hypothetical protein